MRAAGIAPPAGRAEFRLSYDYRHTLVLLRFAQPYHNTELHQLTSPNTAYKFLDDMLDLTQKADQSVGEIELFGKYVLRSWAGIIRSSGVLP